MFSHYWILLLLLFVGPLLYVQFRKWILLPIRMHRTSTVAIKADYAYAMPEHFTPELREMLQTLLPQFQVEGFSVVANLHHTGGVKDTRAIHLLLVNRATGDIAILIAVWSTHRRNVVFAVSSEFPDDTTIQTGVNREIGMYPKDPATDSATFSWITDAHTLCEVHRRRLRQAGRHDAPRRTPAPGQELQYLNAQWDKGARRHVQIGYRYADPAAGLYRFTWKGAFLSTWRLTPPINRWRIAARDRRAREQWHELGMDQWTSPALASPIPAAAAAPAVTPPPLPEGAIAYHAALREGEIRFEQLGDTLMIRMGRPTVGRYLLTQLLTLAFMVFCLIVIGLNFLLDWKLRFFLPRSRMFSNSFLRLPFLILMLFLILDVIKIIRGIRSLRGSTEIIATPRGITFKNGPSSIHTGSIPRHDLAGLSVIGSPKFTRRSLRFLTAHRLAGKPVVLLYGKDLDQLNDMRERLVHTLGLESHATPTSPAAVQG